MDLSIHIQMRIYYEKVLTIAGLIAVEGQNTSGYKTITAHKLYAMSAITALTAQTQWAYLMCLI